VANIITAGRSGFIRRSGVRRRETLWIGGTIFNNTLSSSGAALLISSLNAAALALRPFTIVRTRGQLALRSDQLAANEQQFGAYAKVVVSDQASAIGVTAVPQPITSSESDLFFLYQVAFSNFAFGTAVGFSNVAQQYELDSKAMRKVEEGQDIVTVIQLSSAAGSDGAIMTSFTRILVKLH